ncbi:MAG: choloylglycine hydrolase [Clostridia bacterium]|nr:choloylglycine hydrolase [Clostridia bacterium]
MCTAITYQTKDHYFGRNLDYPFSYAEQVTITPRNFPLAYRKGETRNHHFAIIGMAYINDDYPLYYDAVNEKGLAIAGLNFPQNAVYHPYREGMQNIAPFELIPWLLSQCENLAEAKKLLKTTHLIKEDFSPELPLSPLHWLLADQTGSVTIEPTAKGLQVYDNPVGVLTNNPPFPEQLFHLNNYPFLTNQPPKDRFCETFPLNRYSHGLGGLGLPGDFSSQSRFIRGAFCKLYATSGEGETESVHQFFHILDTVAQPQGAVQTPEGYEKTIYSSCMNLDRGVYYYTTYDNRQITAVSLGENPDGDALTAYPIRRNGNLFYENK